MTKGAVGISIVGLVVAVTSFVSVDSFVVVFVAEVNFLVLIVLVWSVC